MRSLPEYAAFIEKQLQWHQVLDHTALGQLPGSEDEGEPMDFLHAVSQRDTSDVELPQNDSQEDSTSECSSDSVAISLPEDGDVKLRQRSERSGASRIGGWLRFLARRPRARAMAASQLASISLADESQSLAAGHNVRRGLPVD